MPNSTLGEIEEQHKSKTNNTRRLVFVAYHDSTLHQPVQEDEKIQIGPIMGVSFFDENKGDELKVNNLSAPVKFTLTTEVKLKTINPMGAYCAYWDKEDQAWGTEGCVQKRLLYKEDSISIECSCDHLTDFGVLFDPDGRPTPMWLQKDDKKFSKNFQKLFQKF